MTLIISLIVFVILTAVLIGATVYVIGLFVGPLFGAPFVPTRPQYVDDMVRLSGIKAGMRSVDLGCGDGRIVRACAAKGAHATGYEVNPVLVWFSRLQGFGKQSRGTTSIVLGNFLKQDLSGYDVVTAYLMPPLMIPLEKKLLKELKVGARVVSNSFRFPHWLPIAQEGNLYVYEKTLDPTISEVDTRLV